MATHSPTSPQRQDLEPLLERAFLTDDFPLFAQYFLKIKDKKGILRPFVLWPHQRQMWEDRKWLIEQGLPNWRFILKYRQGGFSRYFLAETLFFALRNHNQNILIIAHKKKLPTRFLKDIRDYIKKMPKWCRPALDIDATTELQFTEEFGGSRITITSANTVMEGGGLEVGETYQRIHITEASDPIFKFAPLVEMFQTVGAGCEVIVESTAKGIGNWHNKTYWRAVEGKSKFTPRFVPWNVHVEYVLPVPMSFTPEEEELELMAAHHLTAEQVMWRRWKIEKEFNEDVDKFREQYPLTDVEAFLFTGSSCFNLPALAHFLESEMFCKDWPTQIGDLKVVDDELAFKPSKHGNLEIYRMPEKGADYCIAVDVAEGLVEGDYSVVTVWRGVEQAAEWHGHIDPYELADISANLGYFYNEALLAVEDNDMGSVTATRLFRDLYYPNLYYRENRATADDKVSTKRVGWHTSGTNKGDMVSELALHIKNWERTGFTPHSVRLVNECRTFAVHIDKRGFDRYAAQSGCRDDCPMAAMIALQAMLSWQYGSAPIESAGGNIDKALKVAGVRVTKEPASRYERAMKRAQSGSREWGNA